MCIPKNTSILLTLKPNGGYVKIKIIFDKSGHVIIRIDYMMI